MFNISMTMKAETMKDGIKSSKYIKMQTVCVSKNIVNKNKRQKTN